MASGHKQTAKVSAHLLLHRGIVKITDEKIFSIGKIYNSQKITLPEIEYVDLVGSLEHEKKSEGEATAVLKEMDELAAVIGLYQTGLGLGAVDPQAEFQKIQNDLILLDLMIVEKRWDKALKQTKAGSAAEEQKELELIKKCQEALNKEIPLRNMKFNLEEEKALRGFSFLTLKPILIILNIAEKELNQIQPIEQKYKQNLAQKKTDLLAICAKLEEELSVLEENEKQTFMKELGISQSATKRLVQSSYNLMDLITFYTANEKEVKAWLIPRGSKALKAAGTVHSDMEKGFIKAEVIAADKLIELSSLHHAKEKGQLKLEGKDYIVQDKDVIFFRFNV